MADLVPNRILKTFRRVELREAVRLMIAREQKASTPPARLNHLLEWHFVSRSTRYVRRQGAEPNKPGPKPRPLPEHLEGAIRQLAEQYP